MITLSLSTLLLCLTGANAANTQTSPIAAVKPGISLVVAAVQKIGAAGQPAFVNGYGLSAHDLAAPESVADQAAGALNHILRYQLSPANEQAVAAAAVEKKRAFAAAHAGEAPPKDMIVPSFDSAKQGLRLYTSIPAADLAEMLREALEHPERGGDLRAEDFDRRMRFSGVFDAVGMLGALLSQSERDSRSDDADVAAKARATNADAQAVARMLGADFAKQHEALNMPPQLPVLAALAERPEVVSWAGPAADRVDRTARIAEAYARLKKP
jgi:hypothetical protein